MVYVLSLTGYPLMPTKRHGKVRRLLRDGLAKVVKRCPFTIQLLFETGEEVQPVTLGVDAGSRHIGISATTEGKVLYEADRPYQRVWGEEGHDYRLKCSVILMAMFVLLIPHLFGLEERGKMKEMLFVSSKGRHEIWSVKLMLTVMLSLLSGVLLIIMEIFQYLQCGGNIHDFTLSTQCFLVEYDPLSKTTLFLFLCERFILIFLHMMTNGILVFAISSIWSGYLTGVSISAGVLFAPMLIETLGLSGKTAISAPANLTLSVSWLKDGQAFIIWMLIELALIIAGILTSRAGWKKKMRISFD